jgi:hypothetical protein
MEIEFSIPGVSSFTGSAASNNNYVPAVTYPISINSFIRVSPTQGQILSGTKDYDMLPAPIAYNYTSYITNDTYLNYQIGFLFWNDLPATNYVIVHISNIRIGFGSSPKPVVNNSSACHSFLFSGSVGSVNDLTHDKYAN